MIKTIAEEVRDRIANDEIDDKNYLMHIEADRHSTDRYGCPFTHLVTFKFKDNSVLCWSFEHGAEVKGEYMDMAESMGVTDITRSKTDDITNACLRRRSDASLKQLCSSYEDVLRDIYRELRERAISQGDNV